MYSKTQENRSQRYYSPHFFDKLLKFRDSHIKKNNKLFPAKYPVLSFASSSLKGLSTIHAHKANNTAKIIFDNLQNRHTIVHFLAVALVQGFSFWMYLITVGLFALVLYASIALKNDNTSSSLVGLALMQLISVGFLMASVVGYIVETMSCMTGVERIMRFTQLEKETLTGREMSERVSKLWPEKGEIEFRQLRMKYSEDNNFALKNLNFVIKAGTKVVLNDSRKYFFFI